MNEPNQRTNKRHMPGPGHRRPLANFPPSRTSVDEKYVQQMWDRLRSAFQEIQRKCNNGLSFEELYRIAYNMVLHRFGDRLYSGVRSVIEDHMKTNVRGPVEKAVPGEMMEIIGAVWEDHTVAMTMIRDILMYVDRVYITQRNVEPIYDLGLSIFREEVLRYNGINERLRREMLEMVQQERSGVAVNWMLLKDTCQMLIAIGVYQHEFQTPFLVETGEYYNRVGQEAISTSSSVDYIRRVETYINEEMQRAQRYLDKSTEEQLLAVVDHELITAHMQAVVEMQGSGVVALLDSNRTSDLHKMFIVLSRVPGGRDCVCKELTSWLRACGEAISDPSQQSDELKNSPILYITRLMELRERCDDLLKDAFENDMNFRNKINAEFAHFIEKNQQAAEHLTSFLDEKLKKGARILNDNEMDDAVNRVMALFRFLSDKDVFEHYYKRALARRLLTDRSVSDDAEKQMVSRLRTECGYQYTQKLELMFKDRELWGNMQNNFRDYLSTLSPTVTVNLAETQMRVLTSGVWPTSYNSVHCRLPSCAEQAFQHFKDFYMKQHNGRKIQLNTLMGYVDIKAVFYNPHKDAETDPDSLNSELGSKIRRVETQKILSVSTHQMAVLMLFNEKSSYTFNELLDATDIPPQELQKTMQSLSMGKPTQRILVRKACAQAPAASKIIHPNDTFYVNDSFTSKLHRIKVSTILDGKPARENAVSKEDRDTLREQVNDDRKHEIECAIVRVMKSRKQLDHNNLITQVVTQLAQRFRPTPALIKQRIEALIERDYLARDKNNERLYLYVS